MKKIEVHTNSSKFDITMRVLTLIAIIIVAFVLIFQFSQTNKQIGLQERGKSADRFRDVYLSGNKKTFSVFIPGPKKDNVNIYSDLRENVNYQIGIKPIPYHDFLTDSEVLFGYNDIWNELK